MAIDETMTSFLRLLREHSVTKQTDHHTTFSRDELISLFHTTFENKEDFSEVIDRLSSNKLLDAEIKINGEYRGYFVTDLGAELLRRPDRFFIEDGQVRRHERPTIDPLMWTGKKLVLADERVIVELRIKASELRDRAQTTQFESNADGNDIKALCDALVNICNMVEPDIGVIERILAHPKFRLSAGLVNIVSAIRGAIGL